jgi:phosphonate transport system ATP-binding protein
MDIHIENLCKSFGNQPVLRQINLNIHKGEFVAVLGPSGTGKSTLLRCINGFVLPERGRVFVGGEQVTLRTRQKLRKQIGFIFQGYNLAGNLTVLQNVLMGRLGYKPSWGLTFNREDLNLAQTALEMVGLKDKIHERVDRLSGGQKQRVGIARALVQKPKVLLADEPVSSLDPVTACEILELLQKINKSQGVTVICNLHQLELARSFAQRIVGLNSGRVQYDGPAFLLGEKQVHQIYGNSGVHQDFIKVSAS